MPTRRKPWFRVYDSILYERATDSQLATLLRLMAFMHIRWQRNGITLDQACEVELSLQEMMLVTGKARTDAARRLLGSLPAVASLSVEQRAASAAIIWRNFLKYQENPTPKTAPPETETKKKKKRPPVVPRNSEIQENNPPPRCARVPPRRETLPPENLTEEDRNNLLQWGQKKLKPPLTRSQLLLAEEHTLDKYRARGHKRLDWMMCVRNAMREGWAWPGGRPQDDEGIQFDIGTGRWIERSSGGADS